VTIVKVEQLVLNVESMHVPLEYALMKSAFEGLHLLMRVAIASSRRTVKLVNVHCQEIALLCQSQHFLCPVRALRHKVYAKFHSYLVARGDVLKEPVSLVHQSLMEEPV
jgi:hypothetical protein